MARRLRYWIALVAVAVAAAAAYGAVSLAGGDEAGNPQASMANPDPGAQAVSLRERFEFLRGQHSNRCGMPASALNAMRPGSRLQGACCFPIDYDSYVNQIHDLKRYASISVIPTDPYDVPVRLAKRLIAYESIDLTAAQQRTYDQAAKLSDTKGPCCCPCWRWTAFGGQAKYLITRRGYSARQIADIWNAEEGCGGPSHGRNA